MSVRPTRPPPVAERELGTPPRTRDLVFAAGLVVVLIAWNNVVIGQVPHGAHITVNGAAAVLLLMAARLSGLSWRELGLSAHRLPAGLRWGGAAFALIAAAYAVAVAVPGLRPLVADDRVVGLDPGDVVVDVLVRIPLSTVLWEEVAFRGVLLAALVRVLPLRHAVWGSAVVFGLWHIRPALSGIGANDLVSEPWLVAAAVLAVCVATAAGGLVFCALRLRSGSLLAPALLHLATNSLGTLAALAAHGLG